MIELLDIHKSFGPKNVLNGFSLRVEEGSTTSLVGFSGAGKSVTLKHIVGLLEPDSGSVKVDGEEVVGMGRAKLYELRRRVGYVFQFAALFDSMSIAENLAMGLIKQGGFSEEQIRERIAQSLELVELDGFED
ncbi:MAG TPA: ATP-binding cassette domain-containing protein, partial [Longimicrobiaceae bacterium]